MNTLFMYFTITMYKQMYTEQEFFFKHLYPPFQKKRMDLIFDNDLWPTGLNINRNNLLF